MPKLYRHTFQVAGRGKFPIDMLRRDWCFPASERDSATIDYTHLKLGLGHSLTEHTVTLKCYAPKRWRPTATRWQSFGWHVVMQYTTISGDTAKVPMGVPVTDDPDWV